MTQYSVYYIILWASFPLAIFSFIALLYIKAPYGRYKQQGWGPALPSWLGWVLMETPSPILFGYYFFTGDTKKTIPLIIFFIMWEAHYIHRAYIYPFQRSNKQKSIPISLILLAFGFNLGNVYINGIFLFSLSSSYPNAWLFTPAMIIGLLIFVIGFVINRWADEILLRLRNNGDGEYEIPYGGLYRWISCPNYFGEIIQWAGWAIATWSLPGLAFALWTFANLAPRARAHHKWYHKYFEEYPPERRALIPKIW